VGAATLVAGGDVGSRRATAVAFFVRSAQQKAPARGSALAQGLRTSLCACRCAQQERPRRRRLGGRRAARGRRAHALRAGRSVRCARVEAVCQRRGRRSVVLSSAEGQRGWVLARRGRDEDETTCRADDSTTRRLDDVLACAARQCSPPMQPAATTAAAPPTPITSPSGRLPHSTVHAHSSVHHANVHHASTLRCPCPRETLYSIDCLHAAARRARCRPICLKSTPSMPHAVSGISASTCVRRGVVPPPPA
jgi:hypothetical protein